MSVFRATPKLVTLGDHRGGLQQYEHVRDPKSGMWHWERRSEHVDQALIAAYTENVGHPPRNLSPLDPGYDQWTYNPRKKRSAKLAEMFPEINR